MLLILTSILVVSLAASNLVVSGIVMSRSQNYSTIAYYAAESGEEKALWEVRKNRYSLPQENQSGIFSASLSNGSSYSVDFASSSPKITLTSLGVYLGTRRSIASEYDQ